MAMERLLHALLWLPARLPLRVLYLFADVFFVLLYHVVRYRRGVVDGNLAQCFPEKDLQERRRIARSFYRNFADYIVETVKLLHIGDDEIRRRMVFDNLGLLQAHIAAGRSVAVYFGHAGNWEWAPSVTLHMQAAGDEAARFAQVYRPLSNGAVDALMLRLRSRFGSVSLPKATVFRSLAMWRAKDIVSVTGFMSDQKPSHGDPTVPLLFLGRPTAFISGTETLARRLGMAAIY